MVLDRIDCWTLHARTPLMERAFQFLTREFRPPADSGRIELASGNDCFALIQNDQTVVESTRQFEAHREYLDIQYVAVGREMMGWAPRTPSLVVESPYNPERDIEFFQTPGAFSRFVVTEGHFAIFSPRDLHRPSCRVGNDAEAVCKVVVKVRARLSGFEPAS